MRKGFRPLKGQKMGNNPGFFQNTLQSILRKFLFLSLNGVIIMKNIPLWRPIQDGIHLLSL